MNLWLTRNASIVEIETSMRKENLVLEETFFLVDEVVGIFSQQSKKNEFARACGLTLSKARHLALGCYSLIIDGLGQEAGAISRPMLEAHELLVYLRLDPSRAIKALRNELPKSGEIAKSIDGKSHDFRKHLNVHSSHFSMTEYSTRHLLNASEFEIRTTQPMLPRVLYKNIRDLWIQIALFLHEAGYCLCVDPVFEKDLNDIATKIDSNREQGLNVFELKLEKQDDK